jgi:predicted membrane protein DUF2142
VTPRSPLLPLLGAVALTLAAWVLLMPPFQGPDEAGHFGYAQLLAEKGERPPVAPPAGTPYYSTEAQALHTYARTESYPGDRRLKPPWSASAERTWREVDAQLTDADRGDVLGAQSGHSPLYYGYEAIPYRLASGGDILARLHLMRLWSAALMLVTTLGAWLLVGELTGRDRLLQLAGAACVGLQPMATSVSAGVNPDALLFASWSIALWLGVRVLRRGPAPATVAGLVAATALAALTKAAGLALVPAMVFVFVVAAARQAARPRRAAVVGIAAGAAITLAGVAVARGLGSRAPIDAHVGELRAFASYLWQFYLPALPFQGTFEGQGDLQVWHVWLKTSWAAFASLEVRFPDAAYGFLAAVTVAAFGAGAMAVRRRAFELDRAVLAFFALGAGCLVVGGHWVEFQSLLREQGTTTQGRYLLPLLPLAAVAVAAALSALPRSRRAVGAALVLGGMVALQLFSLAAVAARFYA